jgi:hypothetical protein
MIIKIEEMVLLFFLYIYNHEYSVRTSLHISQLIFRILKLKTGRWMLSKDTLNLIYIYIYWVMNNVFF